MFENLNKGTKSWSKKTDGFEYIKLRDYLSKKSEPMADVKILVYGYYINQLDNGESCTIITDDCFINMPSHCVEKFKSMTEEQDAAINEGKLILANFSDHENKKFHNKTIIFDYVG